jgi:hypothetical protein
MFGREKAIATIEGDRCPWPGCTGKLTEAKLSAPSLAALPGLSLRLEGGRDR